MQDFFEELETELEKARNWALSGTYVLTIFKRASCRHCGQPVWCERAKHSDLFGLNKAIELVDFFTFPAAFATTGDNAWTRMPFPDSE